MAGLVFFAILVGLFVLALIIIVSVLNIAETLWDKLDNYITRKKRG